MNKLNRDEAALFAALPKPPTRSTFRASNIWIVEWLPEDERRTGLQLHESLNSARPGWSIYRRCNSAAEVIRAIEEATTEARRSGMIPVLHIEAHGDGKSHNGLVGPSGRGTLDLLSWGRLIDPLQSLNVATRCNLVVFFASCTGIAGLKALIRGPRAPALAVVGSTAPILPKDLLEGTREFYRRLRDDTPDLNEMVKSSSQQAGSVDFEYEPFTGMCYETMVERLIISVRPEERDARTARLRDKFKRETSLTGAEIERRLETLSAGAPDEYQKAWDEMFMVDLYPENQERFGVDMRDVAVRIMAALGDPK